MLTREILSNPDSSVAHCHCPSVAIGPEGDVVIGWYAYPEEETQGGILIIARRRAGAQKFDPSRRILPDLSSSLGNPVLFFDAEGTLHLLFVSLKGHYWDSAEVYASRSEDLGATWSMAESLRLDKGIMVRHPPVARKNGYLLLPAYDERSNQSFMLTASPEAMGWMPAEHFNGMESIQGNIVRTGPGRFCMMLRPAGANRVCLRTISADDGRSWSTVVRTTLPNPLSGLAAFEVGGDLCTVYNHTTEHQRYPLSLSYSDDLGLSWKGPRHIDNSPHEVSYPSFTVDSEGLVHGAYTFGRSSIRYVCFSRDWWRQ